MQDAGDGLRAGRQGGTPEQHGADLLAAPIGIILLEPEDGPAGDLSAAGLVLQARRSLGLKLVLPTIKGML